MRQHEFNDTIDNYAKGAQKFERIERITVNQEGICEWMVDNKEF